MKEFKRIISLAMVLILCVSLLPMNQNLLKAEAQLDDSTKLKNIILRVYDGKEWTNAVYTPEFDPNNRTYIIKLDIKYKKVQFFFEKANYNQVIEAKDHNKCPVRDSNYTEEYSLRPQDNDFSFFVKASNGSKDREYFFKVVKGLERNAHRVYANYGHRDLPFAFEGDIVQFKGNTAYQGKVFDKWIVEKSDLVLDNPYRIMGEFIMPNSEVDIKAQFKESSDDGSKLRYIIVHAIKDNVWETFYDAAKIEDDTKEYELDINEGYTDFYLTLQTEDFTPYFENENNPEKGYLLRNSNDHIKIQANSSELKIADCQYGFRTEKSILNKGENVLNFKIISKNSQNISEYTLKINNGEVKYTVTFNSNGAEGTMQAQKIKKGEKCTLPENGFTPPENKIFAGWKIGDEDKKPGDKITVNGNIDVKAIWKDIEYKVTFNSNEGTGDMDEKLVKAGEDFELPGCTFTAPEGQEFKAWSVDGKEYPAKTKIKINKETEVTAIWKAIEYKVTFNSNEGTGDMDGKLVKAGEDFELPGCTFTAPEGQEFKAWSVDGQEYPAKAKIKINKETEVKAIWQAKTIAPKPEDENKKYEIKLTQASNGTINIIPTEAKEGELVTVQAVPDYGYELESIIILDENQKLVPMKANQFKMPKGGVSIYAKFKELAPAIYPEIDEEKPIENKRHRRDWYYKDHDEEKNPTEEEKFIEEKEIKAQETKTIITIGSQTLEKVMNGVRTVKNMDSAPYIKRGRTMLPLRYLAEAIGYKVFWLNETRTVVIVDLGLRVEIPVDTNLIIVNGVKYTSDVNPEIVNHRTMLPIANIARALGLKDGEDIIWDEVNRQVTINKK